MGTNNPLTPNGFPEPLSERLDSWKEIAAYLKRDERTVRRWEADGLPVHRKVHKKQASIYAYRAEIDAWWHSGRKLLEPANPMEPGLPVPRNLAPRFHLGRLRIALILVALLVAGVLVFNLAGIRGRIFAPSAPSIHSIAVLPLENLSGDASQEYFVDGMTDALTTDLAQITDVRVISRTSSMQYKGIHRPLPEIAQALGVDTVVEGSVARSGNKVRITVQLIHAASDRHIWAESFEGPANDVLFIQDQVAREVAERVHGKLDSQPRQAAGRGRAVRPDAYEAYLRGLYFFDKRQAEAAKKSAEYFRQALVLDPEFAPAYAGLAEALPALNWFNGRPPVDAMVEAKAAAKRALELDDRLAEAHTALGALLCLYDWNWREAETELKRALELNPNSSLAHNRYMMWLLSNGRLAEAVIEAKRAQQLDPLSFFMNREVGHSLFVARRYDEALEELRRSEELEPRSRGVVLNWVAWIYELQGKQKEAVELHLSLMANEGIPQAEIDSLRKAYKKDGWKAFWTKWIQLHLTRPRDRSAYDMALAEARLAHDDKAWEWMQKSADQREVWVTWIKVDPLLERARARPGYQQLLQRINLVE
jgi:TolB-like protein/Flp pilus assembly protein TadD